MTSILVVEDHAIVREPLARLLRLEGYQAHCAANGNDALEVLETSHVELVLLDMMMPKKDGASFLEILRLDPRWCKLPVIVMTGLIEGSQLDRARELGVSSVLAKARFTIDELFSRIHDCVGEKTAPPEDHESPQIGTKPHELKSGN